MKVLVINAGSSSIKYQLYQMPQEKVCAKGFVERIGEETSQLSHSYNGKTHCIEQKVQDHKEAMELILESLVSSEIGVIEHISEIGAVGHRVVHGAEEFTGSVIIDKNVIASIEKFADLAPLHNPANLTGIKAARHNLPKAKQVACFDTAFHTTIPQVAYMYALPYELYAKYGIRRYGFHGISHRYVARRAAKLLNKGKYEVNLITCHLGNGCSVTAVKGGKSADTSMGFTPLEGLVMGTRSGDFDPAILLYLINKGYDAKTLNAVCNKQSGLFGISGLSNDMRNLSELASKGNERAKLAIEIFCYRIRKYIGSYMAILNPLDAIIFTGGIGENAVEIREMACGELVQVGIELDSQKNHAIVGTQGQINSLSSRVKVFVIPTNEELAVAKDTFELTWKRVTVLNPNKMLRSY